MQCRRVFSSEILSSHTYRFSRSPSIGRFRRTIPKRRCSQRSKKGVCVSELTVEEAFEPKYGLPVVRERISYGQLLRDIRLHKVKEIHWFSKEDEFYFEGPCLVEYLDKSVKQSVVPAHDITIPAAMAAHRVKGTLLPPVPTKQQLSPASPIPDSVQEVFPVVFPIVGLILLYISVQYMNWLRGDLDDRNKLKQREREAAARQRIEESNELRESEAETLANMGYSVKEIVANLKAFNIKYDLYNIKRLVDRAKQQRLEEAQAGKNETKETKPPPVIKKKKERKIKRLYENEPDASTLLTLSTLKIVKPPKKEIDALDEDEHKLKMRQLMRKMKGRGMKLQYADKDRIRFDDVAGIGNAKFEVMEVVDFFLNPKRFRSSGARIPRGVLLCGPPGCGKTMLARAVAGEAGVSFLSVNASEFVEMFVGVGASRVRDLFSEARKNAPSIVFIDEIDAVGRMRGGAMGNDERDQTVNQLLSEMDGFNTQDADVVILGASNRKDVLDPALIRAGRFDRIVYVGLPDLNGRIEILETYLGRLNVRGEFNLRELALQTQRTSGASLANLVNSACVLASREGRDHITYDDIMRALAAERLGPSRPPYSDSRQRRIAIHEASVALMATLLPSIEPVAHVTIIPKDKNRIGQTVLGINEQREITQQFTLKYLSEQLLVVLAPRAGEEIYYGLDEMSSINQRKLVMARRIAEKLLVSDNMEIIPGVGHRVLTNPRQQGRVRVQYIAPRTTTRTYELVDKAMEKRLNDAYEESKSILIRNKPALEKLISLLIKNNYLDGEEVRQVVDELGNCEDLKRRDAERCAFL